MSFANFFSFTSSTPNGCDFVIDEILMKWSEVFEEREREQTCQKVHWFFKKIHYGSCVSFHIYIFFSSFFVFCITMRKMWNNKGKDIEDDDDDEARL